MYTEIIRNFESIDLVLPHYVPFILAILGIVLFFWSFRSSMKDNGGKK